MKRKDDNGGAEKQPDPKSASTPGGPAGGNAPAITPESLVDIGPEPESAEAAAETAPAGEGAPTPDQIEVARLTDRLLRLQADFDNFRKRVNRERDDLQKRAGEAVLADLVPILDNLEFGLQQALKKPGGESFAEGLTLIRNQLMETCRKHGMEAVDAMGQPFDPRFHEAVATFPSPDVPEGTVMAQSRRGYRLGDKLVRAAMVVVSGGSGGNGKKGGEG